MFQAPPTFNGFDPITEPVEVFLQQILRYFAINDIEKARWTVILDTLIEEPALTLYNTALTTPAAAGGIRDDVNGLADAAYDREMDARYAARTQWLRDNYNGQNQQEIIKDLLAGMFQGMKEDPKTFYLRVTVQARRAGYVGDVMNTMVKQTFMNGLHKEIAYKIAEQPRLDLAPTVELATRIWNNTNQKSNQNLTLFPQQVAERDGNYVSNDPRSRPAATPKQILTNPRWYDEDEFQPAQIAVPQSAPRRGRHQQEAPKPDPEIDDLAAHFERLQAQMIQLERNQYNNSYSRNRSNPRNQLDPRTSIIRGTTKSTWPMRSVSAAEN